MPIDQNLIVLFDLNRLLSVNNEVSYSQNILWYNLFLAFKSFSIIVSVQKINTTSLINPKMFDWRKYINLSVLFLSHFLFYVLSTTLIFQILCSDVLGIFDSFLLIKGRQFYVFHKKNVIRISISIIKNSCN